MKAEDELWSVEAGKEQLKMLHGYTAQRHPPIIALLIYRPCLIQASVWPHRVLAPTAVSNLLPVSEGPWLTRHNFALCLG
jgi:hypothetical protein